MFPIDSSSLRESKVYNLIGCNVHPVLESSCLKETSEQVFSCGFCETFRSSVPSLVATFRSQALVEKNAI